MTPAPIVLHQLPPAFGLPISESPPAAKVELYLRLTGTPYELGPGDTRRSPNGLVPYVRWADGRLQGESGDIVAAIEAEARLDAGLDGAALAQGRELARQVESVCYDACLHDRFTLPEGWRHQAPVTAALVAQFAPRWIVWPATWWIRRRQIRRAAEHTMRDPSAGHAASVRVIEAVSAALDGKLFLCGDRPSTVDCAVWPTLVHVAVTPNGTPPREAVRRDPRLVAWIERTAQIGGFALGDRWKGA